MYKFDFVVVGAGFSGAVFAHEANKRGYKVCVIDKRSHIAGNCYSENISGIEVHKFGPHIVNTSSKKIWNYINQFTEFNHFSYRPKVNYRGQIYSFPINLMTLNQLWGVKTPEEAEKKLKEVRIPCDNPENAEQYILSQVGREIYEVFFYGYSTKQWRRTPDKLPPFILKRIPIRLTYDDNYYYSQYQGIPVGGYTKIFEKMLEGIEIYLNSDFFEDKDIWERLGRKIIYTGCIDQLYDYRFGPLEYRTLEFEHSLENKKDIQGVAGMNWTEESIPWTRTIEHKHFMFQDNFDYSIITKEYPTNWKDGAIPYYPINDDLNNMRYKAYRELADKDSKYVVIGRLGRYQYYNMDQAIGAALVIAEKELK